MLVICTHAHHYTCFGPVSMRSPHRSVHVAEQALNTITVHIALQMTVLCFVAVTTQLTNKRLEVSK